jgi:hypothetical protein
LSSLAVQWRQCRFIALLSSLAVPVLSSWTQVLWRPSGGSAALSRSCPRLLSLSCRVGRKSCAGKPKAGVGRCTGSCEQEVGGVDCGGERRAVHCGGSVCPTAVANVSSGVMFADGA